MELELGNLTGEIIQAGREVLGGQGPGVLESVYEEALALEMGELGLGVERFPFIRQDNACLTELERTPQGYVLVALNDTSHLRGGQVGVLTDDF